MSYVKTNWQNDQAPAINATNLNKIENGIYDNDVNISGINGTLGVDTNTWVGTTAYGEGDIVIYNDKIYQNITGTSTTTNPAEDTTNWDETSIFDTDSINDDLIDKTKFIKNTNTNSGVNTYSCNYLNGKLEEIGELVWVNLYGGGAYAGKEITASLSNYTSFKIFYFVDNNLSYILEKVGNKDTNIALNYGTAYTRTIAITNSKITIGDGYYSGSVNNNAIIPAYIIGYK